MSGRCFSKGSFTLVIPLSFACLVEVLVGENFISGWVIRLSW